MSILTRLSAAKNALLGSTVFEPVPGSRPAIEALGSSEFMDFDDPNLTDFFQSGRVSSAGVTINETMALRNSAVYRASSLITSCLAMLGLQLHKKVTVTIKNEDGTTTSADGAERATDHPLYKILAKQPNNWQTAFEFWSYMTLRALFDGIAFAKKLYKVNIRVKGGREIVGLRPLDPKQVTWKFVNDNLVFNFKGETILAADMFWFRSPMSSDGVTGAKLLDVAMETIGLAHQTEKASGNVMRNGAIVGGVLEHPKALDEPAINRLRTQFEERQASPENAGKWIVAEDGLKAVPFGTTLKDAQTAEQREFQIAEIGRFTGTPRPLLGMDETSWGTGIEQLGLFFITYCLLPWFINIEQAVSRSLLSEAEQDEYFAKFNDGALLRGSLADQAAFFSKALGAGGGRGWMTQNEVRDKFNQNPKEGGNDLPQPITKVAAGTEDEPTDPADPASGPKSAGKPPKGNDR